MKILTLSLSFLLFISCASNVRNADVPVFPYEESDYNFASPNDITITFKPIDGKWESDSGLRVSIGADIVTILDGLYPEADSFTYGKITKEQNLVTVPMLFLPLPPIVLKNETEITIRALQIGTLK